jgi:hypothetical protein
MSLSQFADLVLPEFDFLRTESLAWQDAHIEAVTFNLEMAILRVYREIRSHELGFDFGREAFPEEVSDPYTEVDLIALTDPEGAQTYRAFASTSPSGVRVGLAHLAGVLRPFEHEIATASTEFYEVLAQTRALRRTAATQRLVTDQTRRAVAVAWQSGEYIKVSLLLSSLGTDLSRAERAKLAYARKMNRHREVAE